MANDSKDSSNPLHGLGALTTRELIKWFKNPVIFILTVAQPIIWLGLLGKGININGIFAPENFPPLTLTPSPTQQQGHANTHIFLRLAVAHDDEYIWRE